MCGWGMKIIAKLKKSKEQWRSIVMKKNRETNLLRKVLMDNLEKVGERNQSNWNKKLGKKSHWSQIKNKSQGFELGNITGTQII